MKRFRVIELNNLSQSEWNSGLSSINVRGHFLQTIPANANLCVFITYSVSALHLLTATPAQRRAVLWNMQIQSLSRERLHLSIFFLSPLDKKPAPDLYIEAKINFLRRQSTRYLISNKTNNKIIIYIIFNYNFYTYFSFFSSSFTT